MEAWLQGYWIGLTFSGLLWLVVLCIAGFAWWDETDAAEIKRRARFLLIVLLTGPVAALAWPLTVVLAFALFAGVLLREADLKPKFNSKKTN